MEIKIELQEAFYEIRVTYSKGILLISSWFMKLWEKKVEFRFLVSCSLGKRWNLGFCFNCSLDEDKILNLGLLVYLDMASCITHVKDERKGGVLGWVLGWGGNLRGLLAFLPIQ